MCSLPKVFIKFKQKSPSMIETPMKLKHRDQCRCAGRLGLSCQTNYTLKIDGFVTWLIDWLTDSFIGWLIDWFIYWSICWLIDWLVGWLTDCFKPNADLRLGLLGDMASGHKKMVTSKDMWTSFINTCIGIQQTRKRVNNIFRTLIIASLKALIYEMPLGYYFKNSNELQMYQLQSCNLEGVIGYIKWTEVI